MEIVQCEQLIESHNQAVNGAVFPPHVVVVVVVIGKSVFFLAIRLDYVKVSQIMSIVCLRLIY